MNSAFIARCVMCKWKIFIKASAQCTLFSVGTKEIVQIYNFVYCVH